MMENYRDFIENKNFILENSGFDVDKSELNPLMFDFQKDIVRWALKKGRSAIFADCGMGKTLMQLEWAKKIGGKVLIVAPLSVTTQTQREGKKFGYEVTICESQADVKDGINITNYEKLDKFECNVFNGVVLDESSILKSFTGKIRTQREGCVKENIERKEQDNLKMRNVMIELTKEITKKELKQTCRITTPYNAEVEMILPEWEEFIA